MKKTEKVYCKAVYENDPCELNMYNNCRWYKQRRHIGTRPR